VCLCTHLCRDLLEAQLEVMLGQMLSHPNLVHTLAHATVELPPDSLVPFSQAKHSAAQKQVRGVLVSCMLGLPPD
jgi:hypothetical protein